MKKQLLAIVTFLLLGSSAWAQGYHALSFKGITDPNYNYKFSLITGNNAVKLIEPTKDNVFSAEQTLPFAWNFFGQPVSKYLASDNGFITFNTTETNNSGTPITLPSASAPKNSIFAFWYNYKLASGAGVPDQVYSYTYGTAPNRVHVIQWLSVTNNNASTPFTSIAIRIYEGKHFDVVLNQTGSAVSGLIGVNNADGTEGFMVGNSTNTSFSAPTADDDYENMVYYSFKPGPQPNNDVALLSLDLPKYEKTNNNISVKGAIANYGKDNLSSFRLHYSVNGGAPVSMLLSGLNISSLANYNFTHNIPYSSSSTTNASINVWVSLPNNSADGDSTNNNISGTFYVGSNTTPRRVLHEVFTSSTCPPCKPGNEKLNEILNQRVGEFAVVKYQYYFPGTGDPYFTLEALNRGNYYGNVNGVPNMKIDGGWNGNPGGYTTSIFDAFKSTYSYTEMTCKLSMTGNKADVTVDVKPLDAMPTGTYKLYVALVEKNTVKNVKTNGETNFEFVMKKMLPNESGQTFVFPAANQTKTVNASFTFPGAYKLAPAARTSSTGAPTGAGYAGIDITKEHSVEKFYDLHAVAFIVREETKDVMQAAWTAQDWAIGQNEVAKELALSVYPNPNNGNFEVSLPEDVKTGEITVRDINGRLIHTQAIGVNNTSIALEGVSNGIYFVELKAEGKTAVQKVNIIR